MKIALVHDYLKEYGGAERVVEALHEIWPEAPLYTSFVDKEGMGSFWERFKDWDIRTSFAQKIPGFAKFASPLRFLIPWIWESFNFDEYDLVISSAGSYITKGILTRADAAHICYCHTPPRALWGLPTASNWKNNFFGRILVPIMTHNLRQYDFLASQRVDFFIANSENTRERIKKFYKRDAEVIYPPVPPSPTPSAELRRGKGDYYLAVGRLSREKRIDLVIEVCKKLKFPLKIVGTGIEEESLKKISGETVEFLGKISDEELSKVYAGAKALIFTAEEEDFGIVPVEAMAHGRPVIAIRQGGVKETVVDGKTGLFFDPPKAGAFGRASESLEKAIKKFEKMKFSADECRKQAEKFSKARFKREIKEFVDQKTRKTRSVGISDSQKFGEI